MRHLAKWIAAALCAAALAGCGDKKASAPQPAAAAKGDETAKLPSVAKSLADYQLLDFSNDLDDKGMAAYKAFILRSAAAAQEFDKVKFAQFAFPDIANEPDAFKREDLAKARAPEAEALLKAPIRKVRFANFGPRGSLSAWVSPYDMEKEAYVVSFELTGLTAGYSFMNPEYGQSASYAYALKSPSIRRVSACVGCSVGVEVVKKVPKDEAREIEAKLAPFREAGGGSARVAASYYATVDKMEEEPVWWKIRVGTNIDAVGITAPGDKSGALIFLIDGPEFKRK